MRLCYGCMRFCQDSCDICPDCGYVFGTESVIKNHLSYGTCLKNRYITGRALAHGEFAITYIAWDNLEQKTVVVKEYFAKALANRTKGSTHVFCYNETVEKFFRKGVSKALTEAEKLMKLSGNDNIVRIEECFEENNTVYIVTEYLEGKDLKRTLEENGSRLKSETVLNIFGQIFSALAYMHERGIVHGAVSPEKIFLCNDGRVKLLDLGSERLSVEYEENCLSVMPLRGYSAPEQYVSDATLTAATDIYSACAVIYSAVTGVLPVEANRRNVNNLKTFEELGISCCDSLEKALLKGLEPDPSERYQSILHTQSALESAFEIDEDKRLEELENEKKHNQKHKLPMVAASVAGGLAVLGVIVGLIINSLS